MPLKFIRAVSALVIGPFGGKIEGNGAGIDQMFTQPPFQLHVLFGRKGETHCIELVFRLWLLSFASFGQRCVCVILLTAVAELSMYEWNKFREILTNWPKSHLMNYVEINFVLFSLIINFVLVIWLTAEKYAIAIFIMRMLMEGENVEKQAK